MKQFSTSELKRALSKDETKILVLEKKVEETKRKGWTVVGEKPAQSKPKAKKETD